MYILGVGDVTHDASVFLLQDTTCIAAIEGERLSRLKHGFSFSADKFNILEQSADFKFQLDRLHLDARYKRHMRMINYCLNAANITFEQVDKIMISSLFNDALFPEAESVSHHYAHCASGFYTSPFDRAAILAIDGFEQVRNGMSTTTLFGHGHGKSIEIKNRIKGYFNHTPDEIQQGIDGSLMVFENSLGVFYHNITVLIGMGVLSEGKTMGLSAYGKPSAQFRQIEDYIQFHKDGTLSINNREIFLLCEKWVKAAKEMTKEKRYECFANLAYIHQSLLEKMIYHLCHGLYEQTGETNLCITGGVGLNSVANGKVVANTPFENVHIIPPTGDNGIALGAALVGAHEIANLPRNKAKFNPYCGKTYSERECRSATTKYYPKLLSQQLTKPACVAAAEMIADGKIVAWFQDGSEIGPRALGNRSILADPRVDSMKDHLNKRVKHREKFRPFAPACLPEDAIQFFKIKTDAPYMLSIVQAKKIAYTQVPAVIHVDGSARIQTIDPKMNSKFYQLVTEFKKISGIGIVLNTSFNGPGEPIVESPDDAINCFLKHNIDVLFLNGKCFIKNPVNVSSTTSHNREQTNMTPQTYASYPHRNTSSD